MSDVIKKANKVFLFVIIEKSQCATKGTIENTFCSCIKLILQYVLVFFDIQLSGYLRGYLENTCKSSLNSLVSFE